MFSRSQARTWSRARAMPRWLAVLAAISAAVLSGCTGSTTPSDLFSNLSSPAPQPAAPEPAVGTGHVKVALILPLSGSGNAAVAALSMKNAAEMALAEFNNPDMQLLVKDDAGTAPGAQQAAQQALDEGAEIILGPLFALSVGPVGQLARSRNVPVIAFSTDANVAARGVYLLSFLPESDVERIIGYAASQGKKSFAALVPDNAYGTVVEGAFKQSVARHNGRIVAFEHYPLDRAQMQGPAKTVAQASNRADAIFIPDGADAVPTVVQALIGNGIDTKRVQLLGHRPVGRRPDLLHPGARRGLVCGTGFDRLPQFLGPLPRSLRPGSGAHRHACL